MTEKNNEEIEFYSPPILFQFVFKEFYWKKYENDDWVDTEVKIFSLDELSFPSEVEMEEFLNADENERWGLSQDPEYVEERCSMDEIQFIYNNSTLKWERNDAFPEDEEGYETSDPDWTFLEVFETMDEGNKHIKKLVQKFEDSQDKDGWYPNC
jgi:hypothetical protein